MGPVPLGTRPMQGVILLIKFTYLKGQNEKRKEERKIDSMSTTPTHQIK